jgi:hypothetical protein
MSLDRSEGAFAATKNTRSLGTSNSWVFANSISAAVWLAIVCFSRCCSDDTRASHQRDRRRNYRWVERGKAAVLVRAVRYTGAYRP